MIKHVEGDAHSKSESSLACHRAGRPVARSIALVALALLLFGVLLFPVSASAAGRLDSPDQRFVDGLLVRHLFSLAEAHCRRELERGDLTERRRAELSVELSRTHALRALTLPPTSRDVAWQAAIEPLDSFRDLHPESAYRWLLHRQRALVHRARGDLARQEAQVVTTAAPLRQQARTDLRETIGQLEQLIEELDRAIGEYPAPKRGDPPRLTEPELRNLREDVRYQLARTLISQGLTYPAGSEDRTNSIVRARKHYAPLAERDDPVDWNSRLAMARCERLLRNEAVARQRLAPLIKKGPPRIIAAAELELARLNYDVGRPEVARKTLQNRTLEKTVVAEWDYQYLRTLLAIRATGNNPQENRRLVQLTNDLVRVIDKLHGPYWMRRAEALVGRHISESPQSQDAEMLARAAANFYRGDKPDEAIETYDRAAKLAHEAGDDRQAFDLAYTAASVEHHRKQHAAARDRYQRVAMTYPDHDRAAAAHLLAVFNAAQLVRTGGQPALDTYVAMLVGHLTTWPEAESAAQAHLWLGNIQQAQRNWADAIKSYRSVTPESPLFPKAIEAVIDGSTGWLDALPANDPQRRAVARKAAAFYAELLLAGDGQLPEPLNPLQRQLLLAWARARMVYQQEGHDELEQTLRIALQSATPDASAEWKAAARALLVLSLAGQPRKLDQASSAVTGLAAAEGEDLIELVLALNALREKADGTREKALAELQLAVVAKFEKILSQANPSVQKRLNVARAAALVEANRFDLAKQRYAELAKAYPDDGIVQRRYADLLSNSEVAKDNAAWQAALAQWRMIEHRSGKATADWFDAKYHQAQAHHQLGNSKQALRIIKLTSALHPELGGPERKRKFEALKQACEG